MKFNKYIPQEIKELLEKQYKEYIKKTPMTKNEAHALLEWVKDGHSVYENERDVWAEGQVPIEFLTIYREEKYIRQHTKGMNPGEAKRFVMEYYGWDDIEHIDADIKDIFVGNAVSTKDVDMELPFS